MGTQIQASLKADHNQWVETPFESLLASDPLLAKDDWTRRKEWYKDSIGCTLTPAWSKIDWIMVEPVTLYQKVPPPWEKPPIMVDPFKVDNLVPEKAEIEWAMKWLRYNRSGTPSGMKAEHLTIWIA